MKTKNGAMEQKGARFAPHHFHCAGRAEVGGWSNGAVTKRGFFTLSLLSLPYPWICSIAPLRGQKPVTAWAEVGSNRCSGLLHLLHLLRSSHDLTPGATGLLRRAQASSTPIHLPEVPDDQLPHPHHHLQHRCGHGEVHRLHRYRRMGRVAVSGSDAARSRFSPRSLGRSGLSWRRSAAAWGWGAIPCAAAW